jgi:hypothetical protein
MPSRSRLREVRLNVEVDLRAHLSRVLPDRNPVGVAVQRQFAAVRARARARALWGVTRNLRKPSGVTEMPSTAVVVLLQSGRDQPLFWAR